MSSETATDTTGVEAGFEFGGKYLNTVNIHRFNPRMLMFISPADFIEALKGSLSTTKSTANAVMKGTNIADSVTLTVRTCSCLNFWQMTEPFFQNAVSQTLQQLSGTSGVSTFTTVCLCSASFELM